MESALGDTPLTGLAPDWLWQTAVAVFISEITGAEPVMADVMRMSRTGVVAVLVAGVGGLLALVLWNLAPAVDVRVVSSERAGTPDDFGAEMFLVTLAISRPPHSMNTLYFKNNRAKVEARVAGHWSEVQNSFFFGSLATNETKRALLLVPGGADFCRIHLRYARESLRWRVGALLWRCGIKMPPKYWAWAGWPHPEGKDPNWKGIKMEFPLAPSSPPPTETSKGSHNEAMHRMSGTHICSRAGWLWMPLIGDLGRWLKPLRSY